MKKKSPIIDLKKSLKKDKDYYFSWQSNIAMAFFDECQRSKVKISRKNLHEISNNAAKNFLDMLIKQ